LRALIEFVKNLSSRFYNLKKKKKKKNIEITIGFYQAEGFVAQD